MATVKFKLFDNRHLSCTLITNVQNASILKEQLMAGLLSCAVIKPSLIIDLFPICIAANKALLARSHGKLVTKSIYTEILFNLSISKNISQSLLKFGIDDKDSEILVVTLEDSEEVANILSKVEGVIIDMGHLNGLSSVKAIRKVYKINDHELNVSSLTNTIVSKISTKDFVNY